MERARCAGAAIVKPAAETFYGGYAGYFIDPDGHLWEAVWKPANLPEDRFCGAVRRIGLGSLVVAESRLGEDCDERNACHQNAP